jgi:hypothetical protein
MHTALVIAGKARRNENISKIKNQVDVAYNIKMGFRE